MNRTLTLAPLLLALVGCEQPGDCADPTTTTDTVTSNATFEHCDDVLADATWVAGQHTITCDLHVAEGAHLTIEPGATLHFEDGTSLNAGCDGSPGSLAARGTAEAPIRFTSASGSVGSWHYLRLCEDADPTANALAHVTIEHAGNYDNVTTKAGLIVRGTEVHIEAVTVRDNIGYGFDLTDGGRFAEGSSGLSATLNTGSSGRASVNSAGSIPADGSFVGNGEDLVRIRGGNLDLDDAWATLDVPWFVEDDVRVHGTETVPATLVIEPGATVYFDGGEQLIVGGDGKAGGLLAVGTAEAPIVFSAAGSPDPGAWKGIAFEAATVDAEALLEHVEVGYASWGVIARNSTPTLTSVHLHDTQYCGIDERDGGLVLATDLSFANNPLDYCD